MDAIDIYTDKREEFLDITEIINNYIRSNAVNDGVMFIYSPHTTCGLTINEHADPDVKYDILRKLNDLIPLKDGYRHIEGNSHAHIKTTLTGNSLTVIIENRSAKLGTWQGIFLTEFDGPRHRKIWVKIIK